MEAKVKNLDTGKTYSNRKEAKLKMGHANYNRALKNRLMLFMDSKGLKRNNNY